MRKPYYNYWSHLYGDSIPQDLDMTVVVHSNEQGTIRDSRDSVPLAKSTKYCEKEACLQLAQNIIKYMDHGADPCNGFYQYVCGRHADEISVPDTKTKFGVHEILINQLNHKLKDIFESHAEKNDPKSKTFAKQFYQKCLDVSSINKEGLRPLKNLINLYGGWPMLSDGIWTQGNYSWEAINALLINRLAIQTLITVTIDPDPYNNSNIIITIDQHGGSSGNNLNMAAFNRRKRSLFQSAYLDGIIDLAEAFGADRTKASKQLQDVLLFETLVSNMTILDEEEEKQYGRTTDYNLMSIEDLKQELSLIDWDTWFDNLLPKELNVSPGDKIFNIAGLRYLRLLENLIAETSHKTLANYHMICLVEAYVDYLSPVYRKYRKQHRKFFLGYDSDLERWEECLMQTIEHLPWTVSAMYVQAEKDYNLKEDVELLIDNLLRTMERTLRSSPWMDKNTAEEALDKLAEMDHRVAYPSFINNDTKIMEEIQDVDITEMSYFESVVGLTSQQTNQSFMRFKYGENFPDWPYDSPPIFVNAFYRFQSNDVVLPLGLLQEPLMNSNYPKYIQYSRIGLLAGHEMTHAYDVEGSQYDKDGNMRNWWSNKTSIEFSSKIDCVVKQYDNITEPITGKQLQGQKLIGESISDNFALVLAYNAYKIWLKDNSVKEEERLSSLPSFTPFQMFFISYANMWCETVKPEAIPLLLDYEEHALSSFRVDVPLKNFPEFSNAFKCQPGSPMNPSDKCHFF